MSKTLQEKRQHSLSCQDLSTLNSLEMAIQHRDLTAATNASSPLTKTIRLFKMKSTLNNVRRTRSQSADRILQAVNDNLPPALNNIEELKKLKVRITVQEARNLTLDTNTYAIVRCINQRHRTQVIKKSCQLSWQCTFDIPLFSLVNKTEKARHWWQGIIITVCSKDRFRSQFIGQIQLPFRFELYRENNSTWYSLNSKQNNRNRNKRTEVNGEIKVRTGLILEGEPNASVEIMMQLWSLLTSHHRHNQQNWALPSTHPTTSSSLPVDTGLYMPKRTNNISRSLSIGGDYFSYNKMSNTTASEDNLYTKKSKRKRKLTATRKKKLSGLEGKFHQDVLGVTFLEICHAKDLPPERNLARTSFDVDPFVVVSYGASTFRTNTVRHNLNPVWNEKLFFHVKQNEANFHLKFTIYDRETIKGNDLIAWCQVPISDITNKKATSRPEEIEQDMDLFTFPLQMLNQGKWKDKRKPTLTVRAKFIPYDQIRRMFWIALAKNYDAENTDTLSRLQVQSMLETIGSTVTESTIDTFWTSNGVDPKTEEHELTVDQLVDCLEQLMLAEDVEDQRVIDTEDDNKLKNKLLRMSMHDISEEDEEEEDDLEDDEEDDEDELEDEDEDWAGTIDEDEDEEEALMPSEFENIVSANGGVHSPYNMLDSEQYDYSMPQELVAPNMIETDNIDLAELLVKEEDNLVDKPQPLRPASLSYRRNNAQTEKVIRLQECPICHRPNLAKRSQMDIITHVATCAANDWTTVDHFLMGNFLTEAYAQRRWFVKLVRKVSYGKYRPGHDNANIIVQDRRTGQLVEEKMSVYVRLGMRLVYKRMKTGITSKGAQRILTNLTVKQGRRFDSPNSAKEIPAFIKFHKIQLHEVWKPVSSFKTFNEFFYRKLRPGSRPADSPEDPTIAVSPADSRMIAFETVNEATRIWIKGIEFSLKKLLDDEQVQNFDQGALAVFRLAPQDYHRFHSPVDGIVTKIQHIPGQYYTVNPMAIRTTIDVFGENARTLVWIDSNVFGKVVIVCVGAMLVGSILMTAKEGEEIHRADEMGYFAFGGSTLIVIFETGKFAFDHDLLDNSEKTVETLVRVGNHIGQYTGN